MPASTARQVVIDDSNTQLIQYSSGWQPYASNNLDDHGNFGPTLDSTLHGTNTNGTFAFDFSDPDIAYQGFWTNTDNATITNTDGSSATVKFTGINVQWYGILSHEFSNANSPASYSIDGGPEYPLVIDGSLGGQQVELLNQRVFETPVLPFGPHNITVRFDSPSGTSTPLTLTHLFIQNGTLTSPAPSSTLPASTPPSASSLSRSGVSKKTNVAAIVGGLLGSLLFFCLLAFIFFQYQKHRNAKWKPTVSNPFRHRRSIPRPIETASVSTLSIFGPSENPPLPVYHLGSQKLDCQPQSGGSRHVRESRLTSEPVNLDENASYYGGYQTWGQAKALEAAAGSRQRDSYI
ncbi:hypothetical protein CPB84DRAFT_1846351 [Gymnopilus junonius]|uniref:Transmembrane protein n=1 Tax=Gymnopilus junonius TaxID=109634 RepID=A0A9P5NQ16_GYMJU|nr:hypothetical protein CPB84DRAFT_1846351 [Gymnopilus junonius]